MSSLHREEVAKATIKRILIQFFNYQENLFYRPVENIFAALHQHVYYHFEEFKKQPLRERSLHRYILCCFATCQI